MFKNGLPRVTKDGKSDNRQTVALSVHKRTDADPMFITNPEPGVKNAKAPGQFSPAEKRKARETSRKKRKFVGIKDLKALKVKPLGKTITSPRETFPNWARDVVNM